MKHMYRPSRSLHLTECAHGNFTWTVEEFNEKLQFNPDEHTSTSERFAVWKIIVIAAGGFILIALLVTIIAFIWDKLRKKRKGGYNLL